MTNQELTIIKKHIHHFLTADKKSRTGKTLHQAIFNPKDGHQVFNGTDLQMVMDKVVRALKTAQQQINNPHNKEAK